MSLTFFQDVDGAPEGGGSQERMGVLGGVGKHWQWGCGNLQGQEVSSAKLQGTPELQTKERSQQEGRKANRREGGQPTPQGESFSRRKNSKFFLGLHQMTSLYCVCFVVLLGAGEFIPVLSYNLRARTVLCCQTQQSTVPTAVAQRERTNPKAVPIAPWAALWVRRTLCHGRGLL